MPLTGGCQVAVMWQLGLALTCDVSSKDHERVTERTSWRWGHTMGNSLTYVSIEQRFEFKSCWMELLFFPNSEHRAQQTEAQTQGGSSHDVHTVWGTRVCVTPLPCLAHFPHRCSGLYQRTQHFLKLLRGGATTVYR